MSAGPAGRGFGARLAGAMVIGGMGALFAATTCGWGLASAGRYGPALRLAESFREWLAGGGWLRVPLWGAAIAALVLLPAATTARDRAIALMALVLPVVLSAFVHTVDLPPGMDAVPATPRAKVRAVLRWSYRTPETVSRIVAISRDPNPTVREQAVIALGANLVVADIEHATVTRPPRFAASPVRPALRRRLEECLTDSVEMIRAEAARALWKAPVTFGPHPAAAETLAALLARVPSPSRPERIAWIAVDAAAGAPDSGLRAAAAAFAKRTDDTQLARYARMAAEDSR